MRNVAKRNQAGLHVCRKRLLAGITLTVLPEGPTNIRCLWHSPSVGMGLETLIGLKEFNNIVSHPIESHVYAT